MILFFRHSNFPSALISHPWAIVAVKSWFERIESCCEELRFRSNKTTQGTCRILCNDSLERDRDSFVEPIIFSRIQQNRSIAVLHKNPKFEGRKIYLKKKEQERHLQIMKRNRSQTESCNEVHIKCHELKKSLELFVRLAVDLKR